MSFPSRYSSSSASSAPAVSSRAAQSRIAAVRRFPARPSVSSTVCSVTAPPPLHWSSSDRPSRRPPSARRASRSAASGARSIPSAPATWRSRSAMVFGPIRLNANCWHRDLIVAGTFCSSVVARMNIRWAGGSSRIFSSALNAATESMWTSSTMYTRLRTAAGV